MLRRSRRTPEWPPVGRRAAGRGMRPVTPRIERGLTQEPAGSATPAREVQLVARACNGAGLPHLRRLADREWRGQDFDTLGWPSAIGDDQVALLLLTRPAGRVGLAAGRHARELRDPLFGVSATGDLDAEFLCAAMVADWLESTHDAVRLAPPVIEYLVAGQVHRRALLLPELPWHLPAADGV